MILSVTTPIETTGEIQMSTFWLNQVLILAGHPVLAEYSYRRQIAPTRLWIKAAITDSKIILLIKQTQS